MSVFVEVKGLGVRFDGRYVLKDVSFTLDEGQSLGILGKSGSGKTVLMHVLKGLEHIDEGSVIYHVCVCNECGRMERPSRAGGVCERCGGKLEPATFDLAALEPHSPTLKQLQKRLAIMLQRTFGLYGDERVLVNVINALNESGYTGKDAVMRAAELLSDVNMSHRIMHVARELSGGEKQRVVLARQLAKEPMLLLADEPTGTLDLKTAEIVHKTIINTKKKYNMALVITSHWPSVVEELAERAILLENGRITMEGDSHEVAEHFTRLVGKIEKERVSVGEPIIKVQGLVKKYVSIDRGVIRAVDDISFEVNEGEIFGIVGESGSGKTSTAKMLIGLLEPTSGEVQVRVGDEWVDMTQPGCNFRGRATKYMAILHQEYNLYPYRTVLENLTESIGLDLPLELGEQKALFTLTSVGFSNERAEEVLTCMPDELSEGEHHRIALAQVLIKEPRIVILDEPTGTMDPITKVEVSNSILAARKSLEQTFVIVSHDTDFVRSVCDRGILMFRGKIVARGTPDELVAAQMRLEVA
ncbi:MAG: methyl coenzyme M reductase system, component A2 [Methermicoccaceae archaeon]